MNSAEPHAPSTAVAPEVVAAIAAALAQKLRVRPDDVRIAAVRRRPIRRQNTDLGGPGLSVEELAVLSAALSAELGRSTDDVRITSIRAL